MRRSDSSLKTAATCREGGEKASHSELSQKKKRLLSFVYLGDALHGNRSLHVAQLRREVLKFTRALEACLNNLDIDLSRFIVRMVHGERG